MQARRDRPSLGSSSVLAIQRLRQAQRLVRFLIHVAPIQLPPPHSRGAKRGGGIIPVHVTQIRRYRKFEWK